MYIKSMSLDGFKSYAQKQVINDFDNEFNAITGLNGSGKSNILDGICFVLGISNLSHVRCDQLTDLVYKKGAGGTNKATVSITFDNAEKKCSPLGFEHYSEITVTRQIIIGGRNKYMINGTNATNQRVADMFRSVGLNVNNPHFLIMQGRITKVLNMKPHEILGMIEEAAGTKMYDAKRINAEKTIAKKDAKVAEINQLIDERIKPEVEKLQKDKAAYIEFKKLEKECEEIERRLVAHDFNDFKRIREEGREMRTKYLQEVEKCKGNIEQNNEKMHQLTNDIQQLTELMQKEAGDQIANKELESKDHSDKEAKLAAKANDSKEQVKSGLREIEQMTKSINEDEKALGKSRSTLSKLENELGGAESEGKADEVELKAAQEMMDAAAKGMSTGEDGQSATLAAQLMKAKANLSELETKKQKAMMQLKVLKPQLTEKEKGVKRTEEDYSKQQNILHKANKDIENIRAELTALKFDDEAEIVLRKEVKDTRQRIAHIQNQLEMFNARYQRLDFTYDNPTPDFDHRKVKGLVARLLQVINPEHTLAVEVALGDKMYQVVVDSADTGKALLKNGKLKRRVTVIPLDKVSAYVIKDSVVNRAKQLVGDDNCHLALSLVGYDKQLTKALEFALGSALICDTIDHAKKVCFDKQVQSRTVTLAGDVFNPKGTLSGGSRQGESVLNLLKQVTQWENEKNELVEKATKLEKKLAQISTIASRARQLKSELEEKETQAQAAERKLQATSHHQVVQEIQAIKNEIEAAEKLMENDSEMRGKLEAQVKDLTYKMNNEAEFREKQTKSAKKRLDAAKKKIEHSGKQFQQSSEQLGSIRAQIEELEKSINEQRELLENNKNKHEQVKLEAEEIDRQLQQAKDLAKRCLDIVKELKKKQSAQRKQIDAWEKESRQLADDNTKFKSTIEEANNKATNAEANAKDAAKRVEKLLCDYPWVNEEQVHFGKQGTAYDFHRYPRDVDANRLQHNRKNATELKKHINIKAMTLLTRAEDEMKKLIDKKDALHIDKSKMERVITEMETVKKKTIKEAWKEVNKDFGLIFTSLLPGTQAKLDPPTGMEVTDGLEIRVAFGETWKESLSELSGGQRSLVALSLVLAMLRYKPAPIYILDEVDAALDLSHTQNIGSMIKRYFTASQFIIVSLKDGMFNNANVLFRTKFVDGSSTVSRQVGAGASAKK